MASTLTATAGTSPETMSAALTTTRPRKTTTRISRQVANGSTIHWPSPSKYRFDGDPAVGDGIDNNLEYYPLFYTMDIGVFHGTTVAGIVAAMTDNNVPETALYEGFAGTCWHCKLMPLRIINAEGDAFGSDAAEAIYYAMDNGARIINASWDIPPGASTQAELAVLEQAFLYAASHGVLVVAAAGNAGTRGLYFPASMPETIAVGSSNWFDVRSDFSSYASPGNQPPVAGFTYTCGGTACGFDAGSSLDDTGISEYAWNFGDGGSATGQIVQHTFASQGSYSVMLAVTDEDGATTSASTSFRVKNKGNTSGSASSDGGDSGGTTTLEAEKGRRKCTDGIDNDGDGFVDGDDPDCR
jgi:hypothetical protein